MPHAAFTREPSPKLLLIPPFAENAKDGAPDHWEKGKKDSPLPFALLGFHHLGEAQAQGTRLKTCPDTKPSDASPVFFIPLVDRRLITPAVGMTILPPGWNVFRFTCCGYHRIVIPTVVEGPAVTSRPKPAWFHLPVGRQSQWATLQKANSWHQRLKSGASRGSPPPG